MTPETAVLVDDLLGELEIASAGNWAIHLQGSPRTWPASDGERILSAIQEAIKNPVSRPLRFAAQKVLVARTTGDEPVAIPENPNGEDLEPSDDATAHTEVQSILTKLGAGLGLKVWVARNDWQKSHSGRKLCEFPSVLATLPSVFEPATQSTVERIDVLWLDGRNIVAAFEVESTTSIYSGLLRMADLISQQPNLKIQLYLVAPEKR